MQVHAMKPLSMMEQAKCMAPDTAAARLHTGIEVGAKNDCSEPSQVLIGLIYEWVPAQPCINQACKLGERQDL